MRPMPVDVKSLRKEAAELTDQALEALIPGVETVPASIHGAMRHSVFAGGKRLRPLLAYQAAVTIAGALPSGIDRLGAALEMLHTYSLIHDDLPALDNDDSAPRQAHLPRGLRRGHRHPGRRRAADPRLRGAGRAGVAARGHRADHRPHRQRRGHRGGHDRRPGAGPRERAPEAHAGDW